MTSCWKKSGERRKSTPPKITSKQFFSYHLSAYLNILFFISVFFSLSLFFLLFFLRKPLIRRALVKTFGLTFALNGIWKLIWGASLWFGAYWLLKQTISWVRARSDDRVAGHLYAMGFFLSSFVATIGIHQLLSQSGRLGLRVRKAHATFLKKLNEE